MENLEKRYQLIEDHLRGDLSLQDKVEFDNLMSNDSTFSQEVLDHQEIESLAIMHELQGLDEQVKNYDWPQENQEKGRWSKGLVIGALLLGGALTSYLIVKNSLETEIGKQVTYSDSIKTLEHDDYLAENKEESAPDLVDQTRNKAISVHSQQVAQMTTPVPAKAVRIDSLPSKEITTDPTENTSVATTETRPCDNVTITCLTQTGGSCANEATGSLIISQLTGGTPPYKILHNEEEFDNQVIDLLKAGTIHYKIIDANNCQRDFEGTIPELVCKTSSELVLDLSQGNSVTIANNIQQHATLRIFSDAGELMLEQSFYEGDVITWRGEGDYGDLLDEGLYHYTIGSSADVLTSGDIRVFQ